MVKKSSPQKWSYENTVAEVEAIIDQIEAGELPLESVFEQFALATEHLQKCDRFLAQGKERMELLIETLGEDEIAF